MERQPRRRAAHLDILISQLTERVGAPGAASPKPAFIQAQRRGRFTVNLVSNLGNFGLSILVGIWLTPYLIHHLGIAAYGLVPLAVTATSYVGLFTNALNATVGRFITLSLEQHDDAEANCFFNTSLWGSAILLGILLGPVLWLASRVSCFFDIPSEYTTQFTWLFISTVGMFYLTTLTTPFAVAAYCRNRFDLTNGVAIAGTLVRALAILVLFNVSLPRIWHVGLGMVASAGVVAALSIIVWRRLTPTLRVQRSAFSRRALKQLAGMGGWILVNQFGALLFLSVELVLVNRICGAEAAGRYGAILLWPSLLRSLAGVVAGVFGPTVLYLHGGGDTPGLVAYAKGAVKFVGLGTALPIGVVCGLAYPLLRTWLGPSFASLAPLLVIMCIHLCVNLAVLPLFNIQVATKDVRVPGIVTCVMGLANVGLALLLARACGWGMYGVAAAGAVVLSLKNLVFTPLYAAHILRCRLDSFLWEMLPVILVTILTAAAGRIMASWWDLSGYFHLGVAGAVLTLGYLTLTYSLILTSEERSRLSDLFSLGGVAPR
jgi:membrane protein EpsK